MFKTIRPALSKIIPFTILIILAFTYQDVLRSMVLVPLAYLIFVLRLIAGGIGQQTLWISFVVLSTIIAVISLAMRGEVQHEEPDPKLKYPTRLQTWLNALGRKERSQYFKWNLARDLSNLVIEAIAFHQGTSIQQIHQKIMADHLELPSDIREFLVISQKPFAHTGLANYNNGNRFLRFWESKFISPKPGKDKSPLDLDYTKIIYYLEEYLDLDPEYWES